MYLTSGAWSGVLSCARPQVWITAVERSGTPGDRPRTAI